MIKTINETEIEKLLLFAKSKNTRDFTIIHLALSTGLRCSELTGLLIEDVAPYGEISSILTVPERIGKGKKKETNSYQSRNPQYSFRFSFPQRFYFRT